MFNFLHRGIVITSEVNNTLIESEGIDGTYAKSLTAGRVVALNANGVVVAAETDAKLGFLVADLNGNPYQNQDGPVAGVAVVVGNCVFETDQTVDAIVFAQGDKLYAKDGLITNVSATPLEPGAVIGIAGNATTAENPILTVIVA